MIYSENGKIIAEMYPNFDYAQSVGVQDFEKEFEDKTDSVNAELPLYKRITKLIVRTEEFPKTSSGKIKRKKNS